MHDIWQCVCLFVCIETDGRTDGRSDGRTGRQTARLAGRRTDRQAYRATTARTCIQVHTHTHTHTSELRSHTFLGLVKCDPSDVVSKGSILIAQDWLHGLHKLVRRRRFPR